MLPRGRPQPKDVECLAGGLVPRALRLDDLRLELAPRAFQLVVEGPRFVG